MNSPYARLLTHARAAAAATTRRGTVPNLSRPAPILHTPSSPPPPPTITYRARCDIPGCTRDATWTATAHPVYPSSVRVTFRVHCPAHPHQETAR